MKVSKLVVNIRDIVSELYAVELSSDLQNAVLHKWNVLPKRVRQMAQKIFSYFVSAAAAQYFPISNCVHVTYSIHKVEP